MQCHHHDYHHKPHDMVCKKCEKVRSALTIIHLYAYIAILSTETLQGRSARPIHIVVGQHQGGLEEGRRDEASKED